MPSYYFSSRGFYNCFSTYIAPAFVFVYTYILYSCPIQWGNPSDKAVSLSRGVVFFVQQTYCRQILTWNCILRHLRHPEQYKIRI
jgi:tryptophan-rich sensory protein